MIADGAAVRGPRVRAVASTTRNTPAKRPSATDAAPCRGRRDDQAPGRRAFRGGTSRRLVMSHHEDESTGGMRDKSGMQSQGRDWQSGTGGEQAPGSQEDWGQGASADSGMRGDAGMSGSADYGAQGSTGGQGSSADYGAQGSTDAQGSGTDY